MRQLLLMSSSRADNPNYLEHGLHWLEEHFRNKKIVFVPYAGVSISYDNYTGMVHDAISPRGMQVQGLHTFADPVQAIEEAEAIAVGGGNTYMLLHQLYELGLIDPIKRKVAAGIPYAGWSAGSNIAGTSIKTTNDMPIIQPRSFDALKLVPFQINPHYTNAMPKGHRGETRQQRIEEFMMVNATPVLGIAEGTALKISGRNMTLLGQKDGVLFEAGKHRVLHAGDVSQFL